MAQNIIYIQPEKQRRIKRDGKGAIIRISNVAADVLESFLNDPGIDGSMSVSKLASNFIVFAGENTIIRIAEEGDYSE